ncbi:MAG: LiaF-related protein [Bacteroidales bacterium]|jgi:hypothetical protein
MKMGAGLFWGIILIAIGLSIIFKVIFGISIFRIVIAAALILLGIIILIGKPVFHSDKDGNDVVFGERTFQSSHIKTSEYNTIFSKSIYDFRDSDSLSPGTTKLKFNTVFGNTDIVLPGNIPLQVKADAVFSSAGLPDGSSVAFGSANYKSQGYDSSSSRLYIEVSVVFGGVDIVQKD